MPAHYEVRMRRRAPFVRDAGAAVPAPTCYPEAVDATE